MFFYHPKGSEYVERVAEGLFMGLWASSTINCAATMMRSCVPRPGRDGASDQPPLDQEPVGEDRMARRRRARIAVAEG